MWTRQFQALIAKDLRLHGRAVGLTIGGSLALIEMAEYVAPTGAGPRSSFVFSVNLLLTLLWSDWLITRERSKRTFAWLRTLPVDDRLLAGSKFVAAAGCCVVCWTVSSGLFARELWRPLGTGLVLQCALVTFGGLSIATKWRLPWRPGQVAPLVIVLVPVLIFMTVADEDTPVRARLLTMWTAPYGRPIAVAFLLAIYAAIVAVTIRWVRRADTYQLVD
jgi:hypothetical protein